MANFIKRTGAKKIKGYQLRYIYFLNPEAKQRLTVPIIPFSKIEEIGASMYKGKRRAVSKDKVATDFQLVEGGATPTTALHFD